MINLLPPVYKQQIAFAKRNAVIMRYLRLVIETGFVIGVLVLVVSLKLNADTAQAEAILAPKDAAIRELEGMEKDARALSNKLNRIKTQRSSQSHFSALLADLAAVTPSGAFISAINLTGDQAKPVRISAVANSYETAVAIREAIVTSPRIAGADIETISPNSGGRDFSVTIVATFKPGQAR